MSLFRRYIIASILLIISISFSGCASHDPDRESDMPWNMPQSWEGSPSIPGMNN